MAELVREVATPGPGQCLLHVIRDPDNPDGRVFIERADPVVAISHGMIRQVRARQAPAGISLDGDVLVIDAANQRVSYRLEKCGQPGYLLGRLC
jgi:hypothetical protein